MAKIKTPTETEYPSNSISVKRDIPKVEGEIVSTKRETLEPIVQAKRKKKSKWKEAWFGADVEDVGDYLLFQVAIPAFKAMIVDTFVQGINIMFRTGNNPGYTNYRNAAMTGYQRAYEVGRRYSTGATLSSQAPAAYDYRTAGTIRRSSSDFRDILIPTEQKCFEVLDKLISIARNPSYRGAASILDLYELVQIKTGVAQDDNFGWFERDLITTRVMRVYSEGEVWWRLDLPEPVRIPSY